MKSFAYVRAPNEAEASKLLGEKALALAGGTNLLNLMKEYVLQPDVLVDIKGLPDTVKIEGDGEKGVRIGANVTLDEITESPILKQAYPALVQALWDVGSPQIRHQGTLGGNLCARPPCWYFRFEAFNCRKKGGPTCPAEGGENDDLSILGHHGLPCHAVHSSSAAPALVVYGAKVRIAGPEGAREVGIEEFFVLPTQENVRRENVLKPNEIVTHVSLPAHKSLSAAYEVRHMESHGWPIALAAAALDMDGQACRSARICLGAVAPVPWRAKEAEAALIGQPVNEATAQAAAAEATAGAQPMEKNRYKIKITQTAVKRAILAAAGHDVTRRA